MATKAPYATVCFTIAADQLQTWASSRQASMSGDCTTRWQRRDRFQFVRFRPAGGLPLSARLGFSPL